MSNNGRLLTTREAALILGVEPRSVQRRATLEPTGRAMEIIARHKTPGLRGGYIFDEDYIRELAHLLNVKAAAS